MSSQVHAKALGPIFGLVLVMGNLFDLGLWEVWIAKAIGIFPSQSNMSHSGRVLYFIF